MLQIHILHPWVTPPCSLVVITISPDVTSQKTIIQYLHAVCTQFPASTKEILDSLIVVFTATFTKLLSWLQFWKAQQAYTRLRYLLQARKDTVT